MVVEACKENPARVCDQCYSYFNKEDATTTFHDSEMCVNNFFHNLLFFEIIVLSGRTGFTADSIIPDDYSDKGFCRL